MLATECIVARLFILVLFITRASGKTKSLDSSFGASHCGLTTRSMAPGGGSGAAALPGLGAAGKAQQAGEDLQETQNRIINGRQSKVHYPWMVKIVVKEGACGGALVTDRHILTAAHCFCEGVVDCTKRKLGTKKTLTDFSEVSIKAGARKVTNAKALKPKLVVVHKDYQSEEQPKTYDFAVVTLEEPYKANEDMGPICLPGKDHQDMGVKVVTAGWGFTRVSGSCRTNGRGPQTFKECAEGSKCEKKKEVPNSKKCLELVKQISADDMSKFDILKINNETCFYPSAAEGWCYTEKSKSDENWGYCMRSCGSKEETTPDDLEEASLETYPETTCYPGQTNKKQELCVGGRPLKPKTGVFKTSDGKVSLESQSGGGSYDFYGYMDSCQGDSGGPIWQEDGQVATLVGIISRGAECGEKDQPGIAARVTTNLDWIRHQLGVEGGSGGKAAGKAAGKTGAANAAVGAAGTAAAGDVSARLSGFNEVPGQVPAMGPIQNRKEKKTKDTKQAKTNGTDYDDDSDVEEEDDIR